MQEINHETYVSFEVAKLLKKAGFDWEVTHFYFSSDSSFINPSFEERNYFEASDYNNDGLEKIKGEKHARFISAPTLDVTQRWLREKNLLLYIPPCHIDGKWLWRYWITNCINKEDTTQIYSVKEYYTYEEAQEAGIKEALEMISEKGKRGYGI